MAQFKISFSITDASGQALTIDVDMDSIASIDESNLQQELIEHPTKVAWYNSLYALYQEEYQKAKKVYDFNYSAVALRVRRELINEGIKPTEALVKDHVMTDDSVQAALDNVIALERQVNLLRGITKALSDKRDALIQLAGFQKREIDSLNLTK